MKTLAIFLFHCLATFALTGIIWFVQIIQYPLWKDVPEEGFSRYAGRYMKRSGWLLGGIMGLEMVTGVILLTFAPWRESVFSWSMLMLVAIWISTFAIQAPLHKKLRAGKDDAILYRLTVSNWIRTSMWTGRAIILVLISLA